MSHKTYIEIYNLIDDAMQEAGEKVEEACNKLAKSDADPKCVLACNMVEQIKKYQKIFTFRIIGRHFGKIRFGIGRKEDFFKDYDFEQQPSKD